MVRKLKRTVTSVLPVSNRRTGKCIHCGACCRLPYACSFLKRKPEGGYYCSVYFFRPLNCRKYPRTESEFITADTCGYRFENTVKTNTWTMSLILVVRSFFRKLIQFN
ncbi:Uncharacterized protein dnm_076820 [Desulfonema magnum]|uniref:YkgJ family cysteine cluster protein n=1 Tax=Desulfonema magnum TaxID=45655 RepID=A0A975BTV0_9BACT|nr:Uncharacterized protein dnm_076820 [Desulfonema magnum]